MRLGFALHLLVLDLALHLEQVDCSRARFAETGDAIGNDTWTVVLAAP